MIELSERLRAAANAVRTKSMPLSDFIPLLQQAADALDAERERCAKLCEKIAAEAEDESPHKNYDLIALECAAAIRSMKDSLGPAESWDAWRPIDVAPRDGTIIDLWCDDERLTDCWFEGGTWLHSEDGVTYSTGANPTHWMPPPAPPSA